VVGLSFFSVAVVGANQPQGMNELDIIKTTDKSVLAITNHATKVKDAKDGETELNEIYHHTYEHQLTAC
jgi:hypothetical protein